MGRALVLNVTFEPLGIVTTRRAFLLVFSGKADLVHDTGHKLHAAAESFAEPSVVKLRRYVSIPYRTRIALNRRTVFARDEYRCQYCGAAAENIDHVLPRSRGGRHEWSNVVAACRRCNSRKENRLPHEAGMVLRRQPFEPHTRLWLAILGGTAREEWEPYLSSSMTA
jgi:5-methylcytosine-specific restriction endonuclease McrA